MTYKCPNCGKEITDEDYQNDVENGGMGYCFCEFSAIDPSTGDVWYPRILNQMVRVDK